MCSTNELMIFDEKNGDDFLSDKKVSIPMLHIIPIFTSVSTHGEHTPSCSSRDA